MPVLRQEDKGGVMNPEQMRIAIASVIPCRFVGLKKRGLWYRPGAKGYTSHESEAGRFTMGEAKEHEYPHDEPVTIHQFSIPNYPEDLNACHEMETCVSPQMASQFKDDYEMWLDKITRRAGRKIWNATASQRCEAFLRTLNLWKEGALAKINSWQLLRNIQQRKNTPHFVT